MKYQWIALIGVSASLAACTGSTTTMSTTAPVMRSGSPAAEQACLTAVANQTKAVGASVLSSEFSQANTVVYVSVPGADAPWVCYSNDRGQVSNVMYSGSEGRL